MALPQTLGSYNAIYSHSINLPPMSSSTGAVYVLLLSSTVGDIIALKSSDPASVDFTTVGTATFNGSNAGADSIDMHRAGDVVHIAIYRSGHGVWYMTFNMATDAFSTVEAVVQSFDAGPVAGWGGIVGIGVRSDGIVHISYQGANESVMGQGRPRAKYASRATNGTWTINIALSPTGVARSLLNQHLAHAGGLNTHFFYTDFTSSPTTLITRVYQSSLLAEQTIHSPVGNPESAIYSTHSRYGLRFLLHDANGLLSDISFESQATTNVVFTQNQLPSSTPQNKATSVAAAMGRSRDSYAIAYAKSDGYYMAEHLGPNIVFSSSSSTQMAGDGGTNERYAQPLVALASQATGFLTVLIPLAKTGSPADNVTIELRRGADPDTSTLISSSTVFGNTITTTIEMKSVSLTIGSGITAGESLVVVVYRSGSRDTTNYFRIGSRAGTNAGHDGESLAAKKRDSSVWADMTGPIGIRFGNYGSIFLWSTTTTSERIVQIGGVESSTGSRRWGILWEDNGTFYYGERSIYAPPATGAVRRRMGTARAALHRSSRW